MVDLSDLESTGKVSNSEFQKAYALQKQLADVQRQSQTFIKQYATAIEIVTRNAINSGKHVELNESAFNVAIDELAALMLLSYLTSLQHNLAEPSQALSLRFSVRLSSLDSKIAGLAKQLDANTAKREQLQRELETRRSRVKDLQKDLERSKARAKKSTAPTGRKRERQKVSKLQKEIDAIRDKVITTQAKTVQAKVNLGTLSKKMKELAGVPVRESLHSVKKRINDSLGELALTNKSKAAKAKEITKRLKEMGVSPKSPSYIETIVNTHTQLTFGIGQRAAYDDDESVRLLKYMTMEDERVRLKHQKLHGMVRPKNDPIWDKVWPPNGWNCRCWIVPVDSGDSRSTGIPRGAAGLVDSGFENISPKILVGK